MPENAFYCSFCLEIVTLSTNFLRGGSSRDFLGVSKIWFNVLVPEIVPPKFISFGVGENILHEPFNDGDPFKTFSFKGYGKLEMLLNMKLLSGDGESHEIKLSPLTGDSESSMLCSTYRF